MSVEQNYALVYASFRPKLLRFFVRRGCKTRSEDLCQEVFLKVFRGIRSFGFRSSFSTWVFGIAQNHYFNEIRRPKWPEDPLPEEGRSGVEERHRRAVVSATTPSPEKNAELQERLDQLETAIESLPPKMRMCFKLRVYQGLKFQEVAEVAGVDINTVKAHVGEARRRLRKLLP